jgi:hypothetical protein
MKMATKIGEEQLTLAIDTDTSKWQDSLATANQIHELKRLCHGYHFPENLTKGEAGKLIRSRRTYEQNRSK